VLSAGLRSELPISYIGSLKSESQCKKSKTDYQYRLFPVNRKNVSGAGQVSKGQKENRERGHSDDAKIRRPGSMRPRDQTKGKVS